MDDQARLVDISEAVEPPVDTDQSLGSVALARLLDEVRNAEAAPQPTAYNRMHNRHNRS